MQFLLLELLVQEEMMERGLEAVGSVRVFVHKQVMGSYQSLFLRLSLGFLLFYVLF